MDRHDAVKISAITAVFISQMAFIWQMHTADGVPTPPNYRDAAWVNFRDAPVNGRKHCRGRLVTGGGERHGLYEFTCALVPKHRFYTPKPGVAPSDWLPEAPYVRKEPSQ